MSSLQASYEMNQVLLGEVLPAEVEVVCLTPKGYDFRTADTNEKEKVIYLNNLARRLRRDRDKPLIADVSESCIEVLPWTEAEGKQMVEHGLDKKNLEAAHPPTKKLSIEQTLYRRLLLRGIEISLRRKGYMVNEASAFRYQVASTSFAYVYSSGISATNKFFEVYRGAAFRVLLYPKEKRGGLIIDPTFHLLPRATLHDFVKPEHKEILARWGGASREGETVFESKLDVVDVCPIHPEDCRFRISPYESECLLYDYRMDKAISWSRPCLLSSIKKTSITQEPKIRQSIQKCNIISNHISDDTTIAAVTFYGSDKTYSYPLQRLRRVYKTDFIPDFVTGLGGNEQDIRTMNEYFDQIVKMPPSERRWYTQLFMNDLASFGFGARALSFEKGLTKVGIKSWKQ